MFVEPEPLTEVPGPPAKLKGGARSHWRIVAARLVKERKLTALDLFMLELLCWWHGQLAISLRKGEAEAAEVCQENYDELAVKFGLSPVGRPGG